MICTYLAESRLLWISIGVGRIPCKIAKLFHGFTAEQWKNLGNCIFAFCLVSPVEITVVGRILLLHVILCASLIKTTDVGQAYHHLLQFCKDFKRIYGKERVTPNMHLHAHLADCILDYGPVYAFLLFSFERFNGILGKYNKNTSMELGPGC